MANSSRDELEKQPNMLLNPRSMLDRAIGEPINIYQIIPDPKQPRRLLPMQIRYDLPVRDILDEWWGLAEGEAGHSIPMLEILRGEITERSKEKPEGPQVDPGPIELGFMKLIDLAATIRRDGGLINPITIYRNNEGFRLETGERRWLAHHLLAIGLSESQWEKIDARIVDAPSIWRQAHENTARDDLNAISLARQLALLVMDIYVELGLEFLPYEAFQHDRHFYAQVADGRQFPIPYGDAERVASAMGGKSANQIRQFRSLLRLEDHIWLSGDAESLSEYSLRAMVKEGREVEIGDNTESPSHSSTQAHESVTAVTHHNASTQTDEATDEPDSDDESGSESGTADTPASSQLPDWVMDMLKWAHNRAMSGATPWFSASNVGTGPETLNKLIAAGLLEGLKPRENTNHNAAYYRIAPGGCAVIGLAIVTYAQSTTPNHLPPGADQPGFTGDQSHPVSEGEARAGDGKDESGTPPKGKSEFLFSRAERQLIFAAVGLSDEGIDTVDGLQNLIDALEQAIVIQHRKLTELRNRQ